MTSGPAGQLRPEIAPGSAFGRRGLEIERGGIGIILGALGGGVERDHFCLIDPAEMIEGRDRARIEVEPVEKDRLVFREKMTVVAQDDQVVFLDFRVGRVGVLEVDRTAGESGVTDRVIDSAHVRHR